MHEQRPAAAGYPWARAALAVLAVLVLGFCPARAGQSGVWTSWKSETVSLAPRASAQVRVTFAELPLRRWRLVVDGGGNNCDVTVLRVTDGSLLYARNNESRHVVEVPWGTGEEAMISVTNRSHEASFAITLEGPPKDQAQAAYSYDVNRALEAYAGGRRLEAEDLCGRALKADPRDAAAMVLMAGFKRDRGLYDQAADLVDSALAGDLAPTMRPLAQDMRSELLTLRAPLPAPLREGVTEAEADLARDDGDAALTVLDRLLASDLEMGPAAKSRLQQLRGRALGLLGRDFEALDAFTAALQLCRSRGDEAVIYSHMGRLYLGMENLQQARDAYTMALQIGLPSGLDLRAREDLKTIDRLLGEQR